LQCPPYLNADNGFAGSGVVSEKVPLLLQAKKDTLPLMAHQVRWQGGHFP
jgi:hypothetical protein